MRYMECGCGFRFKLGALPRRPFVACPNCGRRLPVRCEPMEFLARCEKCGRFIEKDALDVHCMVCSGKHIAHL